MKQAIPNSIYCSVIIFLVLAVADACRTISTKNKGDDFNALIPAYIKDSVYLDAGNPFSAAKANLGRYFFMIGGCPSTKPRPAPVAMRLLFLLLMGTGVQ